MDPEPRDRYFSFPNTGAEALMAKNSIKVFQNNNENLSNNQKDVNADEKAK